MVIRILNSVPATCDLDIDINVLETPMDTRKPGDGDGKMRRNLGTGDDPVRFIVIDLPPRIPSVPAMTLPLGSHGAVGN